MAILDPLPKPLAQALAEMPERGNRNVWLFTVAKRARYCASPEKVRIFLQSIASHWTDRDFRAEIDRAITRAFETPDRTSSFRDLPSGLGALLPWPPFNPNAWNRRISHPSLFTLDPLDLTAEHVIDTLYPPNLEPSQPPVTQAFLPVPPTHQIQDPQSPIQHPLLCLALDIRSAQTQPRENWRGLESNMQFIVANPMTAETGFTQSGKPSARCHGNATRARRFQVIEFDRGTPREQAAILSSLHTRWTSLVLVVWSGGKSLHGWFNVEALSPYWQLRFFRHAVFLGADASLWDPAKLVRMPGGRRADGTRQDILYLNTESLPRP